MRSKIAKRIYDETPEEVKTSVKKLYDDLVDYSKKYEPRTQEELRDFFQKSDLTWGHYKHEQGI